jgi:hypothetical protein
MQKEAKNPKNLPATHVRAPCLFLAKTKKIWLGQDYDYQDQFGSGPTNATGGFNEPTGIAYFTIFDTTTNTTASR